MPKTSFSFRVLWSLLWGWLLLGACHGALSAQTDTLRQRARGGKTTATAPDTARKSPARMPEAELIALDTPSVPQDSLADAPPRKPRKHSPLRAAILSAVIPGGGQIYNRKYWKAPIAWAILGGTGYWMFSSRSTYRYWRFQYLYRVDSDPLTLDENPTLPTSTLKAQRDQSHTAHELSIIAFTVGYLLTVTDAFVDGHLFDFDVSDDLSFRLTPGQPTWATSPFGLGATIQIRF